MNNRTSGEISRSLFRSEYTAPVWSWVYQRDVGEQFSSERVSNDLRIRPLKVYTSLLRLNKSEFIKAVSIPDEKPMNRLFERTENDLWLPLGQLCQGIILLGDPEGVRAASAPIDEPNDEI